MKAPKNTAIRICKRCGKILKKNHRCIAPMIRKSSGSHPVYLCQRCDFPETTDGAIAIKHYFDTMHPLRVI